MQPYFFPYIGYFQLIKSSDVFVFYDDVQYIKGGWVNRNRIQQNGKVSYINAYCKQLSVNKRINEVELIDDLAWKSKLLQKIHHFYNKAPQYGSVYPLIESIIEDHSLKTLSSLNIHGIQRICGYLNIDAQFHLASTFNNSNLKGTDRVLSLCKSMNTSVYVNAINGRSLYHASRFEANKMELRFVHSYQVPYNQNAREFLSSLSIIDVLMWNDKRVIIDMLCKFDLIK
ncbi:WbqC family protein [Marinoscillum pacificum]|uniref:WbqC family protein n=1 Tax=Marinoscillum pacificum TaxID=392723 RepID=UPI00215822D4|nr:WbqC family protein [Marinoscillum pacificum]